MAKKGEHEVLLDHEPDRPFTVRGRDGQAVEVVVREIQDSRGLAKYMAKTVEIAGKDDAKRDEDSFVALDDLKNDLIACCLYDANTGNRVTKELISAWPRRTRERLFSACQEANALGAPPAAEKEKN